jgi:hypothetical protein
VTAWSTNTAWPRTSYFTADNPASGRKLWKLTVPPTPQIYLTSPLYPEIVAVYQGDATYTPATSNTATVTGD